MRPQQLVLAYLPSHLQENGLGSAKRVKRFHFCDTFTGLLLPSFGDMSSLPSPLATNVQRVQWEGGAGGDWYESWKARSWWYIMLLTIQAESRSRSHRGQVHDIRQ